MSLESSNTSREFVPDHPLCPTCEVKMWLVNAQRQAAGPLVFECQVCKQAKVVTPN